MDKDYFKIKKWHIKFKNIALSRKNKKKIGSQFSILNFNIFSRFSGKPIAFKNCQNTNHLNMSCA